MSAPYDSPSASSSSKAPIRDDGNDSKPYSGGPSRGQSFGKEGKKKWSGKPNATNANPNHKRRHNPSQDSAGGGDRLPGVSKIKASIRQTTRLLAKDTLEPGLRVQTERRLVSLKADLAKAENGKVEQKYGKKYHMLKFFERKKLMRFIKRVKRDLEELEQSGAAQDRKAKLEQELEDARVMLNYVVNFPYAQKYIAIFPAAESSSQQATDNADEDDEDDSDSHRLVLPPLLSSSAITNPPAADDKTSAPRLKMLLSIQALLRAAVEEDVEEKEGVQTKPEEAEKKKDRKGKKMGGVVPGVGEQATEKKDKVDIEEEDDFFGAE